MLTALLIFLAAPFVFAGLWTLAIEWRRYRNSKRKPPNPHHKNRRDDWWVPPAW
jgi:hypothetical protein